MRYPKPDNNPGNMFFNCFLFVHKFEIETEIVPSSGKMNYTWYTCQVYQVYRGTWGSN